MQFVDPDIDRLTDTGKLGDASNVWAIGAIIMRMMNLEKKPKQPSYVTDTKGEMEPQLNPSARKYYSKGLCKLVNECVRFRTYNRIELPDLWDRIQRYTGDADAGYDPDDDGGDEGDFEAMKRYIHGQKHGDGDGDDDYSLEYPQEEYKIWMAGKSDGQQGGGKQGAGDLGKDDQPDKEVGGQDPYDAVGDVTELGEFLKDDLGSASLGDAIGRGQYPGGRIFDENYGDEEEEDDDDPDR